jgi:site-specific DNA-methyltransferase (adenine-specific)
MIIDEIQPYDKNAKKHSKLQIEKIAESIKRFGFNVPIVIDKDNILIAGHGRLEAAKLLGLKEVKLGIARAKVGESIIPAVLVDDLSEDEIKAYRLADNKLNESDWDMGLAIEELKTIDIELLDLTGFSKDLIIESGDRDDEVPNIQEEQKSKLGDLYEIGNHRVLCGDSTNKEDVEILMGGH